MELDRRKFLQVCGVTAGGLLLPTQIALAAPPPGSPSHVKGVLSDLTKCIGCGWCQQACMEWNHLAGQPADEADEKHPSGCLSAETWTLPELRVVEENGKRHELFVKEQCMHCLEPACVSACPVGALQKLDNGPVVYDCTKCIGCRYCMVACPFGIPKFEWDEALPRIRKCMFCADRLEEGVVPACVAACPTGALVFGDREELIAEAKSRIEADPDLYIDHLYGESELGGTSWMYLSPVSFEALGFPEFKTESVTELSEAVATYGTAGVAASVTALLGGLYFLLNKRETEIEVEAPSPEEDEAKS